ncbi:NAD-dependent deacetylase [Chloroflexota bacterium]
MEQLIQRVARDLVNSKYGIALTGAGISTESGISDFRGPSGVWTLNPEAERRAYQGYQEFMRDPKGWWQNLLAGSREHSLGNLSSAMPNEGHHTLAELERMGILKCTITQNIDALHEKAGTVNLLEYHGSIDKLRCLTCGSRFRRDEFDLEKFIRENQLPPSCPECRGIIKSDTVSFGEPIPGDVAEQSLEETWKCDLMLICGTSAVVYPFANLPRIAKQRGEVTIIEVNAEPTPLTEEGISEYLLQGKTGEILPWILEEVKKIAK